MNSSKRYQVIPKLMNAHCSCCALLHEKIVHLLWLLTTRDYLVFLIVPGDQRFVDQDCSALLWSGYEPFLLKQRRDFVQMSRFQTRETHPHTRHCLNFLALHSLSSSFSFSCVPQPQNQHYLLRHHNRTLTRQQRYLDKSLKTTTANHYCQNRHQLFWSALYYSRFRNQTYPEYQ